MYSRCEEKQSHSGGICSNVGIKGQIRSLSVEPVAFPTALGWVSLPIRGAYRYTLSSCVSVDSPHRTIARCWIVGPWLFDLTLDSYSLRKWQNFKPPRKRLFEGFWIPLSRLRISGQSSERKCPCGYQLLSSIVDIIGASRMVKLVLFVCSTTYWAPKTPSLL